MHLPKMLAFKRNEKAKTNIGHLIHVKF